MRLGLATSLDELGASEIVKMYGRRFTVEETFRDAYGLHFRMGLRATYIGTAERRESVAVSGGTRPHLAHASPRSERGPEAPP